MQVYNNEFILFVWRTKITTRSQNYWKSVTYLTSIVSMQDLGRRRTETTQQQRVGRSESRGYTPFTPWRKLEVNMKQTRRARVYSIRLLDVCLMIAFCRLCFMYASCLMYARCLLDRENGVLVNVLLAKWRQRLHASVRAAGEHLEHMLW